MDSRIARIGNIPGELLVKIVVPDLNIGGDKISYRNISSAKKNVFPRSFQVIVDNSEGTGAVPSGDSLGVLPHPLNPAM